MFFKKQVMKTFFPRLRSDDRKKSKSSSKNNNSVVVAEDGHSSLVLFNQPPDLEESSDEGDENNIYHDDSDDDSSCGSVSSLAMFEVKAEELTKEDQDVAMFLSLIDRMSITSLLFILQNHAREVHKIPEQQLLQAIGGSRRSSSLSSLPGSSSSLKQTRPRQPSSSSIVSLPSTPSRSVTKKFRFAEILGGTRIRERVIEIPHVSEFSPDELDSLWWNKAEQQRMRQSARKAVKFYATHRMAYQESVQYLIHAFEEDSDDLLVEHHVKKLASDYSFPRGLETHIVNGLSDYRKAGVEAVLAEQALMLMEREQGDVKEIYAQDRIRQRYRNASLPCRTLSLQLARSDHIEALKASLCSWIPEAPLDTPTHAVPATSSSTSSSCSYSSNNKSSSRPTNTRQFNRWKS